jgi:hypothetical protein
LDVSLYLFYSVAKEFMSFSPHCDTVSVTRLIRISYGDYELESIPPGMALEVPVIPLEKHKRRGKLVTEYEKTKAKAPATTPSNEAAPVQWVRHS